MGSCARGGGLLGRWQRLTRRRGLLGRLRLRLARLLLLLLLRALLGGLLLLGALLLLLPRGLGSLLLLGALLRLAAGGGRRRFARRRQTCGGRRRFTRGGWRSFASRRRRRRTCGGRRRFTRGEWRSFAGRRRRRRTCGGRRRHAGEWRSCGSQAAASYVRRAEASRVVMAEPRVVGGVAGCPAGGAVSRVAGGANGRPAAEAPRGLQAAALYARRAASHACGGRRWLAPAEAFARHDWARLNPLRRCRRQCWTLAPSTGRAAARRTEAAWRSMTSRRGGNIAAAEAGCTARATSGYDHGGPLTGDRSTMTLDSRPSRQAHAVVTPLRAVAARRLITTTFTVRTWCSRGTRVGNGPWATADTSPPSDRR